MDLLSLEVQGPFPGYVEWESKSRNVLLDFVSQCPFSILSLNAFMN